FARLLCMVILRRVDIGVDHSGLEADELHDVDLAAGGPADLGDIRAEGPDGRPGAAAGRQLGADFDPAVGPGGLALGGQAGRSVLVVLAVAPAASPALGLGLGIRAGDTVSLLAGLDDQPPALEARVLRACSRVELPLVVANVARLVGPLGRVRQAAAVEL